jgi:hypothetical protein
MNGEGDGEAELVYQLLVQHNRCPNEKVVLVGYSQGAWVIHDALTYLAANEPAVVSPGHIASIVLVADAHRLAFTGTPLVGTAPAGGQGVFTAMPGFPDNDIPLPLQNITLNICNAEDAVCDFRGIDTVVHMEGSTKVHTQSYEASDLKERGAKAADIAINGGSFWG